MMHFIVTYVMYNTYKYDTYIQRLMYNICHKYSYRGSVHKVVISVQSTEYEVGSLKAKSNENPWPCFIIQTHFNTRPNTVLVNEGVSGARNRTSLNHLSFQPNQISRPLQPRPSSLSRVYGLR